MELLTTVIARVLFSIPFLVFGLMHFMNAKAMAGIVPTWLPGGAAWVYITGVFLVAAGVSIITKRQGALACKLLAILLTLFILTVHLPGLSTPHAQMSMIGLLKDVGLVGGALLLAGIFDSETA